MSLSSSTFKATLAFDHYTLLSRSHPPVSFAEAKDLEYHSKNLASSFIHVKGQYVIATWSLMKSGAKDKWKAVYQGVIVCQQDLQLMNFTMDEKDVEIMRLNKELTATYQNSRAKDMII